MSGTNGHETTREADWLDRMLDERDAAGDAYGGYDETPTAPVAPQVKTAAVLTVRQLMARHPELRPAILEGLLREGETLNLIASSKVGKSWLVTSLAICICTGRMFLDTFPVLTPGDVLLVDNELHSETSAHRIPKVAGAMGVLTHEYADRLHVVNLRGNRIDIHRLRTFLSQFEPGRFRAVVLDAFYRFLPRDTYENDNGQMAELYNLLDVEAGRLGCAFILVHHSSKGTQGGKAVTDVGSGAGSMSRACDAHVALRQHEEEGAVVFDAVVRSWPPVKSMCLRFQFPAWVLAPDLDPKKLKRDRPARVKAEKPAPTPKPDPYTPDRFVGEFLADTAEPKDVIISRASRAPGLSKSKAAGLLAEAETGGLAHRHTRKGDNKAYFARQAQTLLDGVCVSRAIPPTPPVYRQAVPGAASVSTHTQCQDGGQDA